MVMIPLAAESPAGDAVADPPLGLAEQQVGPAFSIFPDDEAAGGEESVEVGAGELDVTDAGGGGSDLPPAEWAEPPSEASGGTMIVVESLTSSDDADSRQAGEPEIVDVEVEKPAAAATTVETSSVIDGETVVNQRDVLIQNAREEFERIGLEIDEVTDTLESAKERLKELKEEHSTAAKRLRSLLNGEDVQVDLPLADDAADKPSEAQAAQAATPVIDAEIVPPGAAADAATAEPAAESLDEAAARQPAAKNADESWRKVPTTELGLDSIKGFGKKKREALLEVAPTLGDLENLRAKAGPMGLQEVLPDGFGEKICGEIENKILDWLSKNRDRTALEAAGADVDAVPPEEPPFPSVANGIDLEADEHSKQVLARARELQALQANTKPPQPIEVKYGAVHEDGSRAARNGDKVTDCNWTAGDKQDSWILGWLSVSQLK
jgi:hypothetical protein